MNMIQPVSDKDPRRQLADLIQRARSGAEKAHRDVAQMCGVDQDTVKAWEEGTDVPRGKQWTRLKAMLYHLRPASMVWQAAIRHEMSKEEAQQEEEESLEETVEVKSAGTYAQVANHDAITPPPPLQDPRRQTTFGPALRIARLNIGFTQDELGQILEVSGGTISQWETETNTPVLENWNRLADALPELRECTPPGVQNLRRQYPRAATNPGVVTPAVGLEVEAPHSGDRPVAVLHGSQIPRTTLPLPPPIRTDQERDAIAKAGIAYAYALRDSLQASRAVEQAKALLVETKAAHEASERRVHDTQVALLTTVGAKTTK